MGIEIEKKFLLNDDSWRQEISSSTEFKQGYFGTGGKASIRVRVEGDKANINIKGATISMERAEYEYAIPLDEAQELLSTLCETPLIEKVRHIVKRGKHKWEIDEFSGDNQGLIVAEVELEARDEKIDIPVWAGQEVSEDERYFNVNLRKHPFKDW